MTVDAAVDRICREAGLDPGREALRVEAVRRLVEDAVSTRDRRVARAIANLLDVFELSAHDIADELREDCS